MDRQRGLQQRPGASARRWCPAPAAAGDRHRRGALNREDPDGREAIGRSRGGRTTKIHLAADLRCRPLRHLTSPGQRHDTTMFQAVLDGLRIGHRGPGRPRTRPSQVIADKAYSSRANRGYLRRRGITATIPEKDDQAAHRRSKGSRGGRPPAFDPDRYKQRNTAERCINKLKQHRAVATRYDKRDYVYNGTIEVASIRVWLRDLTQDLRDTP